jgi:hypothetical protein
MLEGGISMYGFPEGKIDEFVGEREALTRESAK